MHQKLRALGSVMAVLGSAGALAACGSSDSPASGSSSTTGSGSKAVKVAFFDFTLANPYGIATADAAKKAAAAAGATIDVFDGGYDPNKQINQIQDATASGKYQAMVIAPIDGAAVAPVAKAAINAGIKVVAWYTPIGKDPGSLDPQVPGLSSTVADPLVSNGTTRGQLIVQACASLKKATCNVVVETGPIAGSFEKIRYEAIKKVLDRHPEIKQVAAPALSAYSSEAGRTTAQDIAQAHSNVDVYSSASDDALRGAMPVIQRSSLKDARLIGNGATKWGVEQTRSGALWADLGAFPATEVSKATALAIASARGQKVPASVPSVTISPLGTKIGLNLTQQALSSHPTFKGEW